MSSQVVTSTPKPSADKKLSHFAEAGLTGADIRFFQERGKPAADVLQELRSLKSAVKELPVVAPATLKNGFLLDLSVERAARALEVFDREIGSRPLRYVIPTAGAASRQFQLLRTIIGNRAFEGTDTFTEIHAIASSAVQALTAKGSGTSGDEKATLKMMKDVESNLGRFWKEGVVGERYAFLADLRTAMEAHGRSFNEAVATGNLREIATFILNPEGLNYGAMPKALMRFHTYVGLNGEKTHRLALEEHLRTASSLMRGAPVVPVHFILSEEHEKPFARALETIRQEAGFRAHLSKNGFRDDDLQVTWDFQAPNTDSVSLQRRDGQLARDRQGNPLLRKAGHGSLLPNFSQLECDGMWTQNVDNALYDNPQIQGLVITYKKIMAGLAMDAESQVHAHLRKLFELKIQGGSDPHYNEQVISFCREKLLVEIPRETIAARSSEDVQSLLLQVLQRPVVVAGYVPLEPGQAGGGPFVLKTDFAPGVTVRKVNTVEGSEFAGGQENSIFNQGEFFNPVNLFVSRRTFSGGRFDLADCVDHARCFVSEKPDAQGNPLATYERPGFWNGSLARTPQISIPTPSNTFSAIKDSSGKESFLAPLHHPYEGPDFSALDDRRGVASPELKRFLRSRNIAS